MSKYGIKGTELLLKKAEVAMAAIGVSSISTDAKSLSRLHESIDDCIDTLHTKPRPFCPYCMKKLKTYRLYIKRWLEKQKQFSGAPA